MNMLLDATLNTFYQVTLYSKCAQREWMQDSGGVVAVLTHFYVHTTHSPQYISYIRGTYTTRGKTEVINDDSKSVFPL